MKKRFITGLVLMSILLPLIVIDHQEYPIVGTLFLIVGIFLSMVASYELMNMFYKHSPALKTLRYIIPVFSGIIVYAIYYSDSLNYSIVMPLFIVFIIFSMGLIIFTKDSSAFDMMSCIIAITYTGLIIGYVIHIRYLEPFPANEGLIHLRGGRSFGYLYSIVLGTDMFAYLIGIKFGRKKLCPDISPKKTIEGAIGGLIAGSIIGVASMFIFKIVTPSDPSETIFVIIVAFFFSMFLSFMVQIGDLVASKLKRTYDIKDFGNIFPGHGGVLDRFDSLIFSGAVYYIIAQISYFFIW